MRTIIAGGRDFVGKTQDQMVLDYLAMELPITAVLCGMARGADTFGRDWAKEKGIPVSKFPADWDRHGKQAGFMRNEEMARNADALVVFPGGRGTSDMIRRAIEYGLKIEKIGAEVTDPTRFEITETQLVGLIAAYLERLPGAHFDRIHPGRTVGMGRRVKAPNAGMADLVGHYHGWYVAIEVKRPVKAAVQSKEQVEWQKQIEGSGGTYILARSLDDVTSRLR